MLSNTINIYVHASWTHVIMYHGSMPPDNTEAYFPIIWKDASRNHEYLRSNIMNIYDRRMGTLAIGEYHHNLRNISIASVPGKLEGKGAASLKYLVSSNHYCYNFL